MQKNTQPHLWPTWKLSPEEANSFYRGSGRVTVVVDENKKRTVYSYLRKSR